MSVELTAEEQELLAELKEKTLIMSPGRKNPDYDPEKDWERNKIFKNLVYKDVINFSIRSGFDGYVFIHRDVTKGERI